LHLVGILFPHSKGAGHLKQAVKALKRSRVINCIWGWVGLRAEGCRKSRLHRDLILGPSSPKISQPTLFYW